jgi:nicotinamidase-related amidase
LLTDFVINFNRFLALTECNFIFSKPYIMNTKSNAIWDADDCALLLIDYQPEVMDGIHDKDPKLVELNVCTLAKMAVKFDIPVILSTVAVKMGIDSPTIPSLKEVLPGVDEIDRTSMNAWEDEAFVKAVKATERKKLVMSGIVTSVCLAYPAVHALSEGYEVAFVEDAVGDRSKDEHDLAVMRLVQAGAVPNSTVGIMAEWFRDWASPRAKFAREIFPSYLIEVNSMKGFPTPLWAKKNTPAKTARETTSPAI